MKASDHAYRYQMTLRGSLGEEQAHLVMTGHDGFGSGLKILDSKDLYRRNLGCSWNASQTISVRWAETYSCSLFIVAINCSSETFNLFRFRLPLPFSLALRSLCVPLSVLNNIPRI